MTREEALKVIESFFENPLITDRYKAAFNIAMHDIKACQAWNNNRLILVNKEAYLELYEGKNLDVKDELQYAKTHLNSIYGTMVTDSIYCDTDSIKTTEKTND